MILVTIPRPMLGSAGRMGQELCGDMGLGVLMSCGL